MNYSGGLNTPDLSNGQTSVVLLPNGLVFKCHLNARVPFEYWTSEYQTSESLLFTCFRYSDVHFSDPHCIILLVLYLLLYNYDIDGPSHVGRVDFAVPFFEGAVDPIKVRDEI